jgi:hypothetical protein
VKIVLMTTAACFATLSVAAAADLPIRKYPVRAVAPAAPARPGAMGSGERVGGRGASEKPLPSAANGGGMGAAGPAVVAPEQPERPIPEVAASPPAGVEHPEEPEVGGGRSAEQNLQPPAGGEPGATIGGE